MKKATYQVLREASNQEKWFKEFRSNFTLLQETQTVNL